MMKLFLILFCITTFAGPLYLLASGQIDLKSQYQTANRNSAHLAPDPKTTPQAIIQVYSARAFNWRSLFATHTWIAVKEKNVREYTVYQIVGWRLYRGWPALVSEKDIPDRYWYNQKPHILLSLEGATAEKLIPKIQATVNAYPYANQYRVWPGPNSNTFPAFIARHVPELKLSLPPEAIGKDFLPDYQCFAKAPSGTGYQFSLFGLLGLLIAKQEGIEINLLGLVYGIQFQPFAILLPGIGKLNITSS